MGGAPALWFDEVHVPSSVPDRLMYVHDWTQGPISFDGQPAANDFYARGYLDPNGEGGKHATYGGFVRDRPLETPNAAAWKRSPGEGLLADYGTMIEQVVAAHGDGIALNLMSTSATSPHVGRQYACLAAAQEVPGFRVMLQPDMNTSLVNLTPSQLASYVKGLVARGGKAIDRLPDGRIVVSPFKAEAWAVSDWQALLTALGPAYALWPCLVNWPGRLADFARISAGVSVWGERTATGGDRMRDAGLEAHRLGAQWMAPVAVQDYRPSKRTAWESRGFLGLLTQARAAIECNAERLIVPTGNDVSESSNILPSENAGWSRTAMVAHETHRWRHGRPPKTVRSATVISSRIHSVSMRPTRQTALATFQGGAGVDVVEVIEFRPGRDLERYERPATYLDVVLPTQDLSYHSEMTVDETAVDPRDARIAELEEQVFGLTDDLREQTARADASERRAATLQTELSAKGEQLEIMTNAMRNVVQIGRSVLPDA